MVKWWLERGVDGFPPGCYQLYFQGGRASLRQMKSVGKMMGYVGIEHYFYGPHLHDYLQGAAL